MVAEAYLNLVEQEFVWIIAAAWTEYYALKIRLMNRRSSRKCDQLFFSLRHYF